MNGNMNLGKRVAALEKDGGADIKKEISDLKEAVTTAQNEIDTLETKVNAGHAYSTEETVIGTWIDGTTAYEKTYILENPTNNMVLEQNVNHLLTQTGHWVQVGKTNMEQLFPREYDSTNNSMLFVENNILKFHVSGLDILRCVVIVHYTKTT